MFHAKALVKPLKQFSIILSLSWRCNKAGKLTAVLQRVMLHPCDQFWDKFQLISSLVT